MNSTVNTHGVRYFGYSPVATRLASSSLECLIRLQEVTRSLSGHQTVTRSPVTTPDPCPHPDTMGRRAARRPLAAFGSPAHTISTCPRTGEFEWQKHAPQPGSRRPAAATVTAALDRSDSLSLGLARGGGDSSWGSRPKGRCNTWPRRRPTCVRSRTSGNHLNHTGK